MRVHSHMATPTWSSTAQRIVTPGPALQTHRESVRCSVFLQPFRRSGAPEVESVEFQGYPSSPVPSNNNSVCCLYELQMWCLPPVISASPDASCCCYDVDDWAGPDGPLCPSLHRRSSLMSALRHHRRTRPAKSPHSGRTKAWRAGGPPLPQYSRRTTLTARHDSRLFSAFVIFPCFRRRAPVCLQAIRSGCGMACKCSNVSSARQ